MAETLQGRENVYTCQACGGRLVTVDRDAGTTPFMISHREVAGSNCDGPMYSGWYRPHRAGAPTHEWYKPTNEEVLAACQKFSPGIIVAMRQHVELGGLLLREIAGETAGGGNRDR